MTKETMGKIAFKKTDRYKKPVDKCDTAHYNVFSFQALSHRNRGMAVGRKPDRSPHRSKHI